MRSHAVASDSRLYGGHEVPAEELERHLEHSEPEEDGTLTSLRRRTAASPAQEKTKKNKLFLSLLLKRTESPDFPTQPEHEDTSGGVNGHVTPAKRFHSEENR